MWVDNLLPQQIERDALGQSGWAQWESHYSLSGLDHIHKFDPNLLTLGTERKYRVLLPQPFS